MDRTTRFNRPAEPGWDAKPVFCKGVPPRGPENRCTCKGCWCCYRELRDRYGDDVETRGYVIDCTCDIDWECLYDRHRRICFTYDRS